MVTQKRTRGKRVQRASRKQVLARMREASYLGVAQSTCLGPNRGREQGALESSMQKTITRLFGIHLSEGKAEGWTGTKDQGNKPLYSLNNK